MGNRLQNGIGEEQKGLLFRMQRCFKTSGQYPNATSIHCFPDVIEQIDVKVLPERENINLEYCGLQTC